jgi:hypothetical protein
LRSCGSNPILCRDSADAQIIVEQGVQEFSSSSIEADIARLESGIRQLKIQYDMFFVGALPKQPFDLKADVERLIKRYSNAPIRKYAHRFHFNSLVSRYNALSELWNRTLRTQEEGERVHPALGDRSSGTERTVLVFRIHHPLGESESLRALHGKYSEMQRKLGSRNGSIPFETFLKGVASQAARLQEESGCEEVELRLVVQGHRVHLKARPGR